MTYGSACGVSQSGTPAPIADLALERWTERPPGTSPGGARPAPGGRHRLSPRPRYPECTHHHGSHCFGDAAVPKLAVRVLVPYALQVKVRPPEVVSEKDEGAGMYDAGIERGVGLGPRTGHHKVRAISFVRVHFAKRLVGIVAVAADTSRDMRKGRNRRV